MRKNLTRVLRWLVVVHWTLVFIYVGASLGLESRLPPELLAWLAQEWEAEPTASDNVILGLCGLYFLAMAVGSVGLFLLHRWGGLVFAASSIAGLVLVAAMDPLVEHPFATAVGGAAGMITGAILAIVFFSEVLSTRRAKAAEPDI